MRITYNLSRIFLCLILVFSVFSKTQGQTTVTFQPDATAGIDAFVQNYINGTNDSRGKNWGNSINVTSANGTAGVAFTNRSFIKFDLTSIPSNAIVISANLTLSGISHNASRPNASYFQRVDSVWNENTITWNNQPRVITTNQISLATSISATQNYVLDVKTHVQDMIQNSQNNFGWMLRLQNESPPYASLVFASSDYATASKRPRLDLTYFILNASANAIICKGSSTILSASGAAGYTWTPATSLSSTFGSSVTANPTVTTTYTVTGTILGSSGSTTVTVFVNPIYPISATAVPSAVCFGQSSTITANSANTYTWLPATSISLNSSSGASVTATPTSTTTYTVTGIGPNGCSNVTTVTLTINTLPSISATASSSICMGESSTLTARGSASTYSWSPVTALNVSTGASVTATPTSTVTFAVKGIGANGCSAYAYTILTVNPLPTVNAGADANIDVYATPTIGNPASGGTAPYSYQWSPVDALSSASNALVSASPVVTTTYTLKATDSKGCSRSDNVKITVNPYMNISVSGDLAAYFAPDVLQYTIAGSGFSRPDLIHVAGDVFGFSPTLPALGMLSTATMDFFFDVSQTHLVVLFDYDHYGFMRNPRVQAGAAGVVDLSSQYFTQFGNYLQFVPAMITDYINICGFPNYQLFEAAPCANDRVRNWNNTTTYDENENVLSQSRAYSDYLGRSTQTQVQNNTENTVLASQVVYDAFGRAALQTLPAPIDQDFFCFKNQFITNPAGENYSYLDFDIPDFTGISWQITYGEVDRPKAVANTTPGTLGWYYSNNNSLEPYVAASSFPYSRVEFDDNNLGRVKRSTLAGRTFGNGHEAQTYTMPVTTELFYFYGSGVYKKNQATKTISVDQNGIESVTFADLEGNMLATCLSGQENGIVENQIISSKIKTGPDDNKFVDIHLPQGCEGSLNLFNTLGNNPRVIYNILNLKTGRYELINGLIDFDGKSPILAPGYYRIIYKSGTDLLELGLSYHLNYHHFSIYNYDKANRLASIVPPAGYVAPGFEVTSTFHKMLSSYTYNSLGWVMSETTPDAGTTNYMYRKDGKIRFSQNALQKASSTDATVQKFSYTNYDASGRVVESGEYTPPPGTAYFGSWALSQIIENVPPYTFLDPSACTQVSHINYDIPDPDFYSITGLTPDNYKQEFLLGQVSKTSNNAATSWYSYDELGRVKWMVQRVENMPVAGNYSVKTVNYQYDFNGNVTEVAYQKENGDEDFYHYYTYDADKRLSKAFTAMNPLAFGEGQAEVQAEYSYYLHGPLKRTELGNKLQGIDYVYTINGWLKSINSPELSNRDPGKDGTPVGFPNGGRGLPSDLFGMTLDYYKSDYTRDNTYVQTFDTPGKYNIAPLPGLPPVEEPVAKDLFNGLIKAQRWQTKSLNNGLNHEGKQLMYGYLYDKRYQLNNGTFGEITSPGGLNGVPITDPFASAAYNGPLPSTTDDYKVSGITYDLNGNIKALNRNAFGTGLNMDQMTYTYTPETNKLHKVADAIGTTTHAEKDFKAGQADNNYVYDAIGQLTADASNANYFDYDVYGKVTAVYANAAKTIVKVKYTYDEKGYRVKKSNPGVETWYIRDAAGNVMSIYEKTLNEVLIQTEIPIYGAGRIASFNTKSWQTIYELSDHLGNVRTTFAKAYDYSPLTTHFDGTDTKDYLFDFTNVNFDVLKDAGGSSVSKSVKTDASYTHGRPNTKGPSISIPVTPGQKIDGSIYFLSPGGLFPYAGIKFVLENEDANTGQRYVMGGSTEQSILTSIYTGTWTKLTFQTYTVNAYAPNMYLTIYPYNNDYYYYRSVWWDNMSLSITPNINDEGGFPVPQQESITDYYPHGGVMPQRSFSSSLKYRNGYQGQFAEKDEETGFNSFEARMYDGKLGRWMTTDPAGQFHSPYLAMGNNFPNVVDKDGNIAWFVPGLIGGGVAVGFNITAQLQEGTFDICSGKTWARMGVASAAGFGLAYTPGGWAGFASAGLASGFSNLADQAIKNNGFQNISNTELAASTVGGAIGYKVGGMLSNQLKPGTTAGSLLINNLGIDFREKAIKQSMHSTSGAVGDVAGEFSAIMLNKLFSNILADNLIRGTTPWGQNYAIKPGQVVNLNEIIVTAPK